MSQPSPAWPSRLSRAWLIVTATIAPTVSAWTAYASAAPTWQSKKFSDYAAMVLSNTALVFAPFLFYASVSLVLALCYPQRCLRLFGVRFGVYTGVILSVHLVLMWFGAVGGGVGRGEVIVWAALILGVLVPFLLQAAVWFLKRKSGRFRRIVYVALGIVLMLLLVLAAAIEIDLLWITPLLIGWLSLPGWTLLAYARVARLVYGSYGGHGRFRLSEAMWLLTWSGTYMGTWRISVSHALDEYAKLPKEPPKCYICTAAARGHRWLVSSESVLLANGSELAVNLQMRRLKAAEIALKTLAPRIHLQVRTAYDHVGPIAARWLQCRIAADVGYLALKPVEWIAWLWMRCLLANCHIMVERLYRCRRETLFERDANREPF